MERSKTSISFYKNISFKRYVTGVEPHINGVVITPVVVPGAPNGND